MSDKETATIPYFVAEGMFDRQSLTIKRLWIMCILLIVLLVGSNIAWIYYESQFEDFVVTQENEDGYNNIHNHLSVQDAKLNIILEALNDKNKKVG